MKRISLENFFYIYESDVVNILHQKIIFLNQFDCLYPNINEFHLFLVELVLISVPFNLSKIYLLTLMPDSIAPSI